MEDLPVTLAPFTKCHHFFEPKMYSLAHHFHILAKIPFSHLSQTAVSMTNLEDAGKLVLSADLQFHSFWYLKPK